MSLVIDASMTIAWLFHDERSEAAQAVLRRVAAEGARVPALWRLEVANVLRNAVRRGRCDDGYADRSLRRLARLQIIADGETDRHAWNTTRELSRGHDLTLYDASYLELALRHQETLASRDAALVAAARRAGLDVLEG
jgi:predicted nucleic acid-binding protein